MKLFRIVDEKYSAFYDVYSGKGASLYGGRWNPKNIDTIYLSKSIEIAVCEKSYYSIINTAYTLKNKSSLTSNDKASLFNRKYYLTSANFSLKDDSNNDFTNKNILSLKLSNSSIVNNYLPSDSTFSPWEYLPEKWTVKVGSLVYSDGDDSLKSLSARKSRGRNSIVFNDNYDLTKITQFKKVEIFLSACSTNNKAKWNKKGKYSLTHVHYNIPALSMSGIVEVMNKPI